MLDTFTNGQGFHLAVAEGCLWLVRVATSHGAGAIRHGDGAICHGDGVPVLCHFRVATGYGDGFPDQLSSFSCDDCVRAKDASHNNMGETIATPR